MERRCSTILFNIKWKKKFGHKFTLKTDKNQTDSRSTTDNTSFQRFWSDINYTVLNRVRERIPSIVFFPSRPARNRIISYHYCIYAHIPSRASPREDELRVRLGASGHVRRVGLTAVKLGPWWTTIGRVIYSETAGGVGEWTRARVSQKWHLRAAAAVVTVKGPLVAADVTNRRQSLIKSRLPPARRLPFRDSSALRPSSFVRPYAKG
jgi:hypothetical protein